MMKIQPRQLILLDALGALISACLFYFLLARFEDVFGMPQQVVYILGTIAAFFCVTALTSYFLSRQNTRPFLLVLAVLNILYCLATIVLMCYYFEVLTWIGLAYFTCEIGIIGTLATLELKTFRKRA